MPRPSSLSSGSAPFPTASARATAPSSPIWLLVEGESSLELRHRALGKRRREGLCPTIRDLIVAEGQLRRRRAQRQHLRQLHRLVVAPADLIIRELLHVSKDGEDRPRVERDDHRQIALLRREALTSDEPRHRRRTKRRRPAVRHHSEPTTSNTLSMGGQRVQ